MASRKQQVHAARSDARKAAPVIDVGIVISEDERLVGQDGGIVMQFLTGLTQFFTKATALELDAKNTLARARTMQVPQNVDEDETVQRFVKQTTVDKKAIEEHWKITSVVHQIHRRLTARRDIGAKALEEANTLGNRLHNGYVDGERRRAAAEQDRLRREAEADASRRRDEEVARMEAEALKAEEASSDLSAREQAFVAAYTGPVCRGNGEGAAQRAGYKDPFKAAARLLSQPKILAAINAAEHAAAIRQQADARKAEPLDVQVEPVRPNISTAAGGHDRTTHGYEILDANLFIEAFRSGKYGIPVECVQPAPKGLGELARSLRERLNSIPGVRYVSTTKVV